MKLASLKDGSRDGALIVVSKDLARAVRAPQAVGALLDVMEHWDEASPLLQELYDRLNAGRSEDVFDLSTPSLAAPLPRAPQWLDASAFHSHGDLLERVFGMKPIERKREIPLMYQGASDDFLGAVEDMPLPSETDGIDFEAEVAIIVDRVPMGTSAADANRHIKLVMLANDASLRVLAQHEVRTGFGFLQAKPATSFSPVAVTVDELGAAWRNARVHLPLTIDWNEQRFGQPNAGEMGFGFDELIAHAARTRNLSAGAIIGSGTVANADFRRVGSACIAERRGIEILDNGEAKTEFMKFGDRVRIEMRDRHGQSIFGAIDQRIVKAMEQSQ